jgi:hypothetical protein
MVTARLSKDNVLVIPTEKQSLREKPIHGDFRHSVPTNFIDETVLESTLNRDVATRIPEIKRGINR